MHDFQNIYCYNSHVFEKIDQQNSDIWETTTNNPIEARKKAERILKAAEKENYQLGIAEGLLNIGRSLIYTAEYDEAEKSIERALDIFRLQSGERSSIGEMRATNALGVVYFEKQEFEKALNQYFLALTQSEVHNNDEIKIRALNNIGEIHNLLNNVEEALSYDHQALSIAEKCSDKSVAAVTMINLGELYLKINDLTEAEEYYNRALKTAEKTSNTQIIADAYLGAGKIHLAREEFFPAENKISEAYKLYDEISDKAAIAECYYQFGLLGIMNSKFTDADEYLNRALEAAVELGMIELQSRVTQKLSEIKKKMGYFEEALSYFETFFTLHEATDNDSLKNRLKKITILYETEQTETEKEAYRMQSLELEKSNKEIQFINEIGREVTSSLHLDDIIHNTYSRMAQMMDISSFGIALLDENKDYIEFTFIVENSERHEPVAVPMNSKNSLTVWCIKNRKPVLITQRSDSEKYIDYWEAAGETPAQSAVYIPMIHGQKLIGCMTVQNYQKNMYSESDVHLLGAISSFLAIALDNSKTHQEVNKLNEIITSEKKGLEVAYRKIAHMANHDALTDLPNRHLLRELMHRGIKIAEREKQKMAVLYMDLDGFKVINDTLGHNSGDEVLRIAAQRLNDTLRASDTVARIGGDEFVATLYNIDSIENILAVTDKIIAAIGEKILIKGRTFQIGISIGIAVYPDTDTTIEGLLMKADKAMYKVKQSGKNNAALF